MVTLRNFEIADVAVLQQEKYDTMPTGEIQDMICAWNNREFHEKYFEMFAIISDDKIVGTISLFQRSESTVSIGLEVFAKHQRQGIGKHAFTAALEICKIKGYTIACQQVLVNNLASIALHQSLGFETDRYCYKNRKGEDVYIFLKAL